MGYMTEWLQFKQNYGKTYSSPVEEQQRYEIFKVNVDFIHMMNSRQQGYELGVTEFADLTADEFGRTHFGIQQPEQPWGSLPQLGSHEYSGEALADSVDWRTKGAVTPVKNQGQCGSCWSFSTTGALEGAWQIAGNKLTSLSEQQFVDCDKVADQGCNGGLMDNAFKFAEKNAICTESSYPYKARGGTCEAASCTVGIPKGDVKGYKDVTSDNEQALMSALRQQLGSRSAPRRVWYGWRQGLLEGEKFLGNHVWRKRVCPIASRQKWVWRVRSALSTILSSCKWLWTGTRSFAPSATIASFSTKPIWFHALRKTTMPL